MMSGSLDEGFLEKLRRIKELDSVIDLSKSSIQLEILLLLGMSESSALTASEIARGLGIRRKAVTDALRKLLRKGLIIKSGGDSNETFSLSESGREYLKKLLSILGHGNYLEEPRIKGEKGLERLKYIVDEISTAHYIHEVLLCLAAMRKHEAAIETLAKAVNLSPQRLRTYLDLYTDCPGYELRLFKRVYKPSLLSYLFKILGLKRNRTKVYYRLTKQGLKILYRLPTYTKMKKNPLLRILLLLTMSCHFKVALRKALLMIYTGTLIAFISLLFGSIGIYIASAWFFIMTLLIAIIILASE